MHCYEVTTTWTGNLGSGTSSYRAYRRDHEISVPGKLAPIPGSSDAAYRGDASRYNPEELLVAALSACHMLWMLHLCADAGIVVTAYSDTAIGRMSETRFTGVTLRPCLEIADPARAGELAALHQRAHELCYIAHSVNFPVRCEPVAN